MHGERIITLHHADAAERELFNRLRAERPELNELINGGIQAAEKQATPRILAGGFGATAEAIDATIARHADMVIRGVRHGPKALRWDATESLFWRRPFEAVCREARDRFLVGRAAVAKGIEAMFLLKAAADAAVEADALARQATPAALPAPPPPPHALAMPAPARRPLRPEDFGALARGGTRP